MGLIANTPIGYFGFYNKEIYTNEPTTLFGFYGKEIYTNGPIVLVGYAAPKLPVLTGVPTLSSNEGTLSVSASFVDMGIGEIHRCGFLSQDSLGIYIQDGFESGTLSGLTISSTNASMSNDKIAIIDAKTTSGSDSNYAVKLCSSGSSQTSKVSFSVAGPLNFSFSWKVSSESKYDKLNWYVDDALQGFVSGEVDWQKKAAVLTAGAHTVSFTYSKNSSGNSGSDCGWIDDVTFGMKTPTIYEPQTIPTETGQEFTANLTDLPSGVSYIAAFAENAAGKVVSEFVSYRNISGWEGGLVYGLRPEKFTHFVMGNALVPRTKVNQVVVGERTL